MTGGRQSVRKAQEKTQHTRVQEVNRDQLWTCLPLFKLSCITKYCRTSALRACSVVKTTAFLIVGLLFCCARASNMQPKHTVGRLASILSDSSVHLEQSLLRKSRTGKVNIGSEVLGGQPLNQIRPGEPTKLFKMAKGFPEQETKATHTHTKLLQLLLGVSRPLQDLSKTLRKGQGRARTNKNNKKQHTHTQLL